MAVFLWHLGRTPPSVALEQMIIARLTLAAVVVAAVVPR